MRKLLSANFSRLWKEKLFWLTFAFMLIGSVAFSCISDQNARDIPDVSFYVEDIMFNMLPMIGFVFVFFISMRLGTEYDEHTIRNKLIVGYNRTQVYFSEYITCLVSSLLLLTVMLLTSALLGWFFFRQFQFEWTALTLLLFCCVLMAAVFSAISVGISMNAGGKAASLMASILFLFALMFLASYCIGALAEEPTTYTYVSVSMDGVQFGDLIDNPAYVDGVQRTIYELIADLLPTGQAMQLNDMNIESSARWPLLSIILLFVTTLAGFLPFRKKDIK